MNEEVIKLSDYLYYVCGLSEDDDLDPEDCLEVIRKVYTSSDCDTFASVIHEITGWPIVQASWQIDGWGIGHHTLNRCHDGRLVDAYGYVDEKDLKLRYLGAKKSKQTMSFKEFAKEDGLAADYDHEDANRVVVALQNLPYEPFDTKDFIQKIELFRLTESQNSNQNRPR